MYIAIEDNSEDPPASSILVALPVLDCASSIWDPYHQNQINRLEMIQHMYRAAHYLLNQP